jgi:hypothetical protein
MPAPVFVLVDGPTYLNIPYFQMPDPTSREDQYTPLDLIQLSKLVGRRCAAWVNEHSTVRLVRTRNYLPLKTSVHAHWLAFETRAIVDEFVAAFPRYDLAARVNALNSERDVAAEKIERRLRTGKFDLSRLPEQDRLPVARRYIELTEKLRETEQRIKDLQLAGDLAIQWAGKAVSTYLANPHPAS